MFSLLAWDGINDVPDHAHGPHWMLHDQDQTGFWSWEYQMHNSDDNPAGGAIESADLDTEGFALEYAAIIKRGNFYEGWLGNDAGGWIRAGNLEYTGGEDIVALAVEMENQITNYIGFCDFVRYLPLDSGSGVLP